MRLVSMALERYGRFEDCELSFRAGSPDLHVVYGANEAGKSTSLAAVSDLLFGFPPRSPFNFIFDYSMLRVGAVLEEDGEVFPCRRKKGSAGTLVDADDRPIDEGRLRAMLRGQTRETFRHSFSLDQNGLRAGGKAMVAAQDDLGRALFAAGSGLTGVSDELARLESEADAIWGPRAAARRTFTQAQREFEDQTRVIRDSILRPKTWLDAKAAVQAAQAALDDAQQRRDRCIKEASRAERIRRMAPSARLRADHLADLATYAGAADIARQREEAAELAMGEADSAARAKSTAETLASEAAARMNAVTADAASMTQADHIDALVTESGAVEKARRDMTRLDAELAAATVLVTRLRDELGAIAAAPPPRMVSARLRDMALAHIQDAAALSEIEESEEDVAQRRLSAPAENGGAHLQPNLVSIVEAVDAARAMGADADARCDALQRVADAAAASLDHALARLAPWSGDGPALLALPRLAQHEIDEARTAWSLVAADLSREIEAASRAREEASDIELQMAQLASGAAVSAEEVEAARSERNDRWRPLRDHVLAATPLPSPTDAVSAFEATVAHADERGDLRFAAADESSRLADMGQRRAKLLLEAEQADARHGAAAQRDLAQRAAWTQTLTAAGYPNLEPGRLLGWTADRLVAEAAYEAASEAAVEAQAAIGRRDNVRAALAASLAAHADAPAGPALAPLLTYAERVRRSGEESEQSRRMGEAAHAQIEQDAQNLVRRRKRVEERMAVRSSEWRDLAEESGVQLEIAGGTAALDLFEELRSAIAVHADLQERINGIQRDALEHDERVLALANTLGVPASKGVGETLSAIRSRLETARSNANVLATLQETVAKREAEATTADARLSAATESLAPLLAETGATDAIGLIAAIERSRAARALREAIAGAEAAIVAAGDGKGLDELIEAAEGVDPDSLAASTKNLASELTRLNAEVDEAAAALGDANRAFIALESDGASAVEAASDAEQARAELGVLSEHYILKRAQAVTLRWAIERYRESHQDPLLLRASELFSTLTIGRYVALKVDNDGNTPRLLGLLDDGRSLVDVGAMSEGTTDQLYLALRLAAVEQSVAAGIRLPFLADDLFVNFDDERSEAGFRVLAELARSTQVLFFTHHPHLTNIARSIVGAEVYSECVLA